MLLQLMVIVRCLVGIVGICIAYKILKKYTSCDRRYRPILSLIFGIFIWFVFSDISKLPSERRIEEEKRIEYQQKQDKIAADLKEKQESEQREKTAKETEEKEAEAAEQVKFQSKRAEASEAVQKFVNDGIIQKVVTSGDNMVEVWAEPKFMMLPYDYKNSLCTWVAAATFKDKHGFISIVDVYSGNIIGSFGLSRGLKMEK